MLREEILFGNKQFKLYAALRDDKYLFSYINRNCLGAFC